MKELLNKKTSQSNEYELNQPSRYSNNTYKKIEQRTINSPLLQQDAGFWKLEKEHRRDPFKAFTPRNQNPLVLKRLQQEYSKKLLDKQQQLRDDLSKMQENSEEIASNCKEQLAYSYVQKLDERDCSPLMPRDSTSHNLHDRKQSMELVYKYKKSPFVSKKFSQNRRIQLSVTTEPSYDNLLGLGYSQDATLEDS